MRFKLMSKNENLYIPKKLIFLQREGIYTSSRHGSMPLKGKGQSAQQRMRLGQISSVKRVMGAIGIMALGLSFPGWSQTLADPTRPPAAWLASQAKAGPGASTADAVAAEAPPQLQSLLLGGPRKYAIIDGQIVGVGDTFKDARVVAVTASGVVLRNEQGTQTLKLFPDVDKRAQRPAEAGPLRSLKLDATPGRGTVTKETK